MEILVVNPNTTASMTDKIRAAAEAVASRGTRITAVNPAIGPESIEGYYDEALAVASSRRSARARRAASRDTSSPASTTRGSTPRAPSPERPWWGSVRRLFTSRVSSPNAFP